MLVLFDLPNELLQNIVDHVRGPNDADLHKRYADLLHLSLTSRRLRSMAQSALIEYVDIRKRFLPPGPYGPLLTTITLFLRTILEQPNFGRKMRHLRVEIFAECYDHTSFCEGPTPRCTCGWEEVAQLSTRALPTLRTRDGAAIDNSAWSRLLSRGCPFFQLGLILMFTPELRCVELVENQELKQFPMSTVCVGSVFGKEGEQDHERCDLDFAMIPGFTKLTELSYDGALCPKLVGLPMLKAVRMSLGLSDIGALLHDWSDIPISTSLQRLSIRLNYGAFFPHNSIGFAYIYKLLDRLPSVTHLFLEITDVNSWYRNDDNLWQPRFTSFLSHIEHQNLEVLSFDASVIGYTENYYIEQDRPINNARQFPKLRHLVAPQDFMQAFNVEVAKCSSRVENEAVLQGWRDGWNEF